MSETTPEPKEPISPKKGAGKGKGEGKENIFTKEYGPLKGWVWVLLLAAVFYTIITIRKKKAASTSSVTTSADTTTSTGGQADWGTSSDTGGSAGGFYGGGGMPTGGLTQPPPNTGSTTQPTPFSGAVVATDVDEQIASNAGIPKNKLFVGGVTRAGYHRPTDLSNDPGLPGEIYVGQAVTGSPPGSIGIQGATRTETDTQLKQYLAAHPVSSGGSPS